MAARTKSFFDQDHMRKPRPGQWSRRQHDRPSLNEAPAIPPPPKPPIPATSQAKSKLQAFQFVAGESGGSSKDAPSAAKEDMGDGSGSGNASAAPSAQSSNTSKTPQIPHANTFPCTPGARLPLEDLIGNCDETIQKEPVHESPEEHIGWVPNSSSDALTPNRRKRKRAKSSSPSCPNTSSQDRASGFFGADAAPSTAKRTPAADPATDLWQRYANGRQSGEMLNIPEIGNLFQGSPKPLETPVKGGPLRRWASTGNDWPSTKNKKRCTSTRQSINVWQDQTAAESGGKSKVATMVQKIQETLASQKLEQAQAKAAAKIADAPSSSSPLPDVGADVFPTPAAAASPLQTRQPNVKSPLRNVQAQPRVSDARPPSQRQQFRPTQSGGLRFDSTRPVGDPLNPGSAGAYHLHSKAPLPAYKRPSITRPPSQPKVQQVIAPPPVPRANKDLDEFGDDAFDLTADDLDELLSQAPAENRNLYDIPQHPNPPLQQGLSVVQKPAARAPAETITIDDDDEFGDDDIDEDSFVQAEFSATQAPRISPRKRSPRKKQSPRKTQSSTNVSNAPQLQRYVVNQIIDGEYTNDKGRRCPEKVVLADNWKSSRTTALTLRGSWMSTALCKGNVIHVARLRRSEDLYTLERTPLGQITIDDNESSPFLIVHPDHMLSATTVADSFDCIRKAVLQDRIKATGETSKAMVYGKILHEIFQQALSANQWDDGFLSSLVDRTIQAHVEGLWELGMADTNLAAEEIKAKMGELAAWAGVFVRDQPSDVSLVDDKQGEKVWMSISKLIAIEEHIWSPQFGLKGNVDATIQTTLVDNPQEPGKKLIVPFEVKTGRTTQSPAHRAQTALYTLLLSDRYDVAVEAGILYYLESSSMSRIAPPIREVRQMVQQRNRLASYIFRARHPPKPSQGADGDAQSSGAAFPQSQEIEESGLPTLLKNPYKCGRCYAQQSCFTFHALVENGSAESAGMVDDNKKNHSLIWKEAVHHMLSSKTGIDADMLKRWFTKWDKLLTYEEGDQARFRKELWTMSSTEREAIGRCFGNLVLKQNLTSTSTTVTQQVVDGIEGSGGKINRYAYVFTRASSSSGGSFAEGSQLTVGEPVVISSEKGQWALANGYIVAVAKREITVAVDRKLGDARQRMSDFDEKANQAFRGTMTVGTMQSTPSSEQVLYRLDKDEFSNGLALVRNNLVTLMSSDPIHTKLREQVVFGAKPTFDGTSTMPEYQPTQLGAMNEDQQAAVTKVLNAQDYALILGMPGTGKTTTIAHIIRALLAQNKSILLTSFTHTAVDNILLKIRDIAPRGSILRLGVPAKINNQVQEFCQLAATPRTSIEEVEAAYMGTKIVATTCMGTNHALFNRRSFDVCIVDEASQITLPTILGPLLHARKFVLVGDHFQLPPLVQNKAALEGGMDVSLFRQLSEEHDDAVAALGRQYRMCAEIMMLSNELIYHGQLRCGNEDVANRTLRLADGNGLARFHRPQMDCKDDEQCWLRHLTSPEAKVVFANTDLCGKAAMETLTAGAKNITNQLEALVSAQLVLSFLAMGVPAKDIGVITLYRSQLSLMRQLFKKAGISTDVEIDSADRYQGRDKECIILSMVRSNDAGIVGDLLKDWRRVNVALTRARSKLVVLGSRRTLVNNELLAKFLALVDREKWAMDLPRGCEEMHGFEFSTQVTQQLVLEEENSPSKKTSPSNKLRFSQSPSKKPRSSQSPSKKLILSQNSAKKLRLSQSPKGILKPSFSSGNVARSPAKSLSKGKKTSPKRIRGGKGSRMTEKLRLARERIAMEMMFDDGEFGDDLMEI